MTLEKKWNTPITLEGKIVRLEPLTTAHIPGLAAAGKEDSIWKYMVYGNLSNLENMGNWVNELLFQQAAGTDLPFTVIQNKTGVIIGATRFLDMQPRHRSLEVGGTWYALEYQGSAVNPECKFLLLRYAFEELKCIRVQFKADLRNERSIHAITKLGAVREGVLRNQMILPDGIIRDSVYFSILDREWPDVKIRLIDRINR
ncbi:MAG: GNAT family N-acetyltransferase [Anaerolineales bacterium]